MLYEKCIIKRLIKHSNSALHEKHLKRLILLSKWICFTNGTKSYISKTNNVNIKIHKRINIDRH